jgi:response regulator RpfG family c-di-GMP phosphodiesterase
LPCSLSALNVLLVEDGGNAKSSAVEELLAATSANVLLAESAYRATLLARRHDLHVVIMDGDLGCDSLARISACPDLQSVPIMLLDVGSAPGQQHSYP